MIEKSKVFHFKKTIEDVLGEQGTRISTDNDKIQQLAGKIKSFLEQTTYGDDGEMIVNSDLEDSSDGLQMTEQRITRPKQKELAAAAGGKYIRKKSSKKKKYTKKLKKHKKKTIKKRKSNKIKSKKRK